MCLNDDSLASVRRAFWDRLSPFASLEGVLCPSVFRAAGIGSVLSVASEQSESGNEPCGHFR